MKYAVVAAMTLFLGCATTKTVDKSETTTTTTTIDTVVVVKIPDVIDTTTTTRIETPETETWVSQDTSFVGPVKRTFKATRNKKTGETSFAVSVPDQKVRVEAKKTVVNEKRDVQVETKSWLSEIKGIVIWVVVGLVAVLIGIGLLKKSLGL